MYAPQPRTLRTRSIIRVLLLPGRSKRAPAALGPAYQIHHHRSQLTLVPPLCCLHKEVVVLAVDAAQREAQVPVVDVVEPQLEVAIRQGLQKGDEGEAGWELQSPSASRQGQMRSGEGRGSVHLLSKGRGRTKESQHAIVAGTLIACKGDTQRRGIDKYKESWRSTPNMLRSVIDTIDRRFASKA